MKTPFVTACLLLSTVVLALAEEAIVPNDVAELRKNGELHNAVLMNNSGGRLIDQKTGTLKGESPIIGRPVNPKDVMIVAEAFVPDEMVQLYTSIERLPDSAEDVRILYTVSADKKKATLIGFSVERPRGTYVAFFRYDGTTPWLEWITKSFSTIDTKSKSKTSPPKAQ